MFVSRQIRDHDPAHPSAAAALLSGPALAAEVEYDPGDTVYFTYCSLASAGRPHQARATR